MYEVDIFRLGMWVGYFVTLFCFVLAVYIGTAWRLARVERFVRHIKRTQSLEEYLHKKKYRLVSDENK